jgi:glycosyltransferase involved in cell wall biosynthesis
VRYHWQQQDEYSPVRIAVWHNLPSGGGKRALYDHVRGLLARGHTVEAWCPPTADPAYLPLNRLIPEHVVGLEAPEAGLARRMWWGLGEYRTTKARVRAMEVHCRECARQIEAGGFDVLFANSCQFYGAPFIGRYVDLPAVLYLQEPYRYLYEAAPRLPWPALDEPKRLRDLPAHALRFLSNLLYVQSMRIRAREELQNAEAFDAVLVNSLFSREAILRVYGVQARTCYLGVDAARFRDERKPREPFVLGLGAMHPLKNLGLVLRAVGRVTKPRPPLVWVGNAADPEYLSAQQELVKELGVDFQPRVRVTDAEVLDLLNRASVLLYAPRLEPFGFAPLEANACGLPVVAVAEGGVRETVIDGVNGLVVEPDADAMARAIEWLRDDPAYARTLAAQGRELVEKKWSLERAIDRLEAQLLSAVSALRASGGRIGPASSAGQTAGCAPVSPA